MRRHEKGNPQPRGELLWEQAIYTVKQGKS